MHPINWLNRELAQRAVSKIGADGESLARPCGSAATLESAGKRTRCSKCGTKGAQVVAIALPGPKGREVR